MENLIESANQHMSEMLRLAGFSTLQDINPAKRNEGCEDMSLDALLHLHNSKNAVIASCHRTLFLLARCVAAVHHVILHSSLELRSQYDGMRSSRSRLGLHFAFD